MAEKLASSNTVNRIGLYSAILASVFSIFYSVAQIGEWLGLLGSGGGTNNPSTALGLTVLLTPSLLLGSSFLVLMVSVHYIAKEEKKIFSHIGMVFAILYAVFVSMNYYVQLTFVTPHLLSGDIGIPVQPFLFTPFDSFVYSVDILGYSFMSLSTLFSAFVFSKAKGERLIRWALIANGLIIPFLAFQIQFPVLIWGGALWGFTFPACTILLALFFKERSAEAGMVKPEET
jgi:hypothetical protein